jgi:predicted permease
MQFFIIYIALPPLFYKLISDKPLNDLANWWFVFGTTFSTYCAFALSFVTGMAASKGDLPQATLQGVAGAYSNVGYMGPPLVLAALGQGATAPVVLIFVFDSLLLFTLVPLLMTIGGAETQSLGKAIRQVIWRVGTHPFNIATAAGVLASYTQFKLPVPAATMVNWLSAAAAPCALFLLGVTVALRPLGRIRFEVPVLVLIKLVIHPLIVWAVLTIIGGLPALWVYAAMLMAALPPALNIFVLSTQYKVGMERASACILVGTLLSMVTLTAFLYLIKTGTIAPNLFPL